MYIKVDESGTKDHKVVKIEPKNPLSGEIRNTSPKKLTERVIFKVCFTVRQNIP